MMSEIVTGVMRKTAKKRSNVRVCVPIYMCVCVFSCGGQVQGISTFLFVACISLFCLPFYLAGMYVCMCMCVHSYVYCGGKTALNCSFNRKILFCLTKVNLILCFADRILYLQLPPLRTPNVFVLFS